MLWSYQSQVYSILESRVKMGDSQGFVSGRMHRIVTFTFLLAACFSTSALAGTFIGNANAALYWGNHYSIGRANLDGSNVDQTFVSTFQSRNIGSACGVAVNDSHIYWADASGDVIGRANLDGTDPNYAFITGAREPCGVAVDDSYVYWANRADHFTDDEQGSVGRAMLDGSEVQQEWIHGIRRACGVEVDDRFAYWTNTIGVALVSRALLLGSTENPPMFVGADDFTLCGVAVNDTHLFWGGFGKVIGRMGIDGADPDPAFISGIERPCDLAVDNTHIYWTEQSEEGLIGKAELDGTDVERGIITGHRFPCGIAVDSVYALLPSSPPPYVPPYLQGTCNFVKAYRDPRGGWIVVVEAHPASNGFSSKTKGMNWRPLSESGVTRRGLMRAKLRFWLQPAGRVASRIRRQLTKRGHASIKLEIRCGGFGGLFPAEFSKRATLRAKGSSFTPAQGPERAEVG